MDKFREGEDNPFDAPIPGQGLIDEPENYPWEHPPQFTDPDEAADFVWDRLHRPEFMEQVIAMLDAGIPVEALGRIIIFNGFMDDLNLPIFSSLITFTSALLLPYAFLISSREALFSSSSIW